MADNIVTFEFIGVNTIFHYTFGGDNKSIAFQEDIKIDKMNKRNKYRVMGFCKHFKDRLVDKTIPIITDLELWKIWSKRELINSKYSLLYLAYFEEMLVYEFMCQNACDYNDANKININIVLKYYELPNIKKHLPSISENYMISLSRYDIPNLIDFYKKWDYDYVNVFTSYNLLSFDVFSKLNKEHFKNIHCFEPLFAQFRLSTYIFKLEQHNFKGEYDKYYNYFCDNINEPHILLYLISLPPHNPFHNIPFTNAVIRNMDQIPEMIEVANADNAIKYIKHGPLKGIFRFNDDFAFNYIKNNHYVILSALVKYHPQVLDYSTENSILWAFCRCKFNNEKLINTIIKALNQRQIVVQPIVPELLKLYKGAKIILSNENCESLVGKYETCIRNCFITKDYSLLDMIVAGDIELIPEYIIDNRDYLAYISQNSNLYMTHIDRFAELNFYLVDHKCATLRALA